MKRPVITRVIFCAILLSALQYNTQLHAQAWQWAQKSSGLGGIDAWGVATDPSGNIFAAGYTLDNSSCTFDTVTIASGGNPQVVVAKYNSLGTALWAKRFTGIGKSLLTNIAADHSGNLIVMGSFSGQLIIGAYTLHANSSYNTQYFITKFDSSGNVLWADTTAASSECASYTCDGLLGFPVDYFIVVAWGGITTDTADNIYITGNFEIAKTFIGSTPLINTATGSNDVFVAKYNSSGSPLWASSFGGSNDDEAYSITVSSAGNVYVAGSFNSPTINFGTFTLTNPYPSSVRSAIIAEYDPTGTPIWAKAAGGSNGAIAASLTSDASGNVYVAGGFANDTVFFSSTPITKVYHDAPGLLELFALTLAPTDSVTMVKTIGSPSHSVSGCSIAVTQCGDVWVAGMWNVATTASVLPNFIYDSANIDGTIIYTPDSSSDPIFLAGFSASGSLIGHETLQSGGDDQVSINIYSNNPNHMGKISSASGISSSSSNLYICGDFQNRLYTNFIVGNDTLANPLYSPYYESLYLGKLDISPCEGGTMVSNIQTGILQVYPVPAFDVLNVGNVPSASQYLLLNQLGKTVKKGILDAGNNVIPLRGIPPGVYILQVIPSSDKLVQYTYRVIIG